jgi:hypothetical protein
MELLNPQIQHQLHSHQQNKNRLHQEHLQIGHSNHLAFEIKAQGSSNLMKNKIITQNRKKIQETINHILETKNISYNDFMPSFNSEKSLNYGLSHLLNPIDYNLHLAKLIHNLTLVSPQSSEISSPNTGTSFGKFKLN